MTLRTLKKPKIRKSRDSLRKTLKKVKTKRRKSSPEKLAYKKKIKEWSISVRNRDKNECILCRFKHPRLNAHHILPKDLYPDLQFNVNVGVSLCPMRCHRRQAHWNSVAFIVWLMEHRPEQWDWIKKYAKL